MNVSHTMKLALFAILLIGIMLAANDLLVSVLAVLLLAFAGILFGVFLNGIAQFLSRHTSLAYGVTYSVVVAVLILAIAAGLYYLGSQISERVTELSGQLNQSGQQLIEQIRQAPLVKQYLPTPEKAQEMLPQGGGAMSSVVSGLGWLGWSLTGLAVVFFVGIYVAYDPHLYEAGLVKLFPHRHRDRSVQILRKIRSALGRWIIGRMISMTIIGVATAIGLSVLGVPLPVMLGVIAALLTFIPNIGPILAAIPQILMAFQVGTDTVMYVIIFNLALEITESYIITPIVQRYEVSLPPAVTILMQLLMGVLVGVIGVIMAAPLTVVLMLLVQMLYIRDELGDPHPGELAETQ